jgi:nitrite reductase/ring-hydroxylating ferredoxin subunit
MLTKSEQFVRAASLAELEASERLVVSLEGHTVVLFFHQGQVHAVDNRCPHMGFPLHRGTLKEGILTCHWHHARFDLASGGTFDQFADDVRCYPVQVRDGEVWVDLSPRGDPRAHQRARLRDGLEHVINLVIAKAVVSLVDLGEDAAEPFRIGLDFGTLNNCRGWGPGLTMHTAFVNLQPYLDPDDRPRALFKGLTAVAWESRGKAPRFQLRPLPNSKTDPRTLKQWFRQFVEVRDDEGAERCIVSAVRAGADHREMTDLLFAAATDHRFIASGHVVDFTNKALEALDVAGWEHAEQILSSLASGFASASRAEEANQWRHPIDLVALLETAFDALPAAVEAGRSNRGTWVRSDEFVATLLGDEPQAIVDGLLGALRDGATETELAAAVAYAAALRIARFHTSNEFGDWDTALHTFSFAHAVHMGLRRSPSTELVRGVFDGAMSVYLDRFLNIPPAPLPGADGAAAAAPGELQALLDRQQQVNPAGAVVGRYLASGADPAPLLAMLCKVLLREDRDFHSIQTLEACVREFELAKGTPGAAHFLVAAARYMAAHFPTVRSQEQIYQIAVRLHRGEKLYEEA